MITTGLTELHPGLRSLIWKGFRGCGKGWWERSWTGCPEESNPTMVCLAKESGLYRMSDREPVIMFKEGRGQRPHSIILRDDSSSRVENE